MLHETVINFELDTLYNIKMQNTERLVERQWLHRCIHCNCDRNNDCVA